MRAVRMIAWGDADSGSSTWVEIVNPAMVASLRETESPNRRPYTIAHLVGRKLILEGSMEHNAFLLFGKDWSGDRT